MKIRAITGFLDPGWPLNAESIQAVASCMHDMSKAFEQAGYEVQTLRLATPPPSEITAPVPPMDRPAFASDLEAQCFVHGIDYANIGPALPDELEGYQMVPEILRAAEIIFCSGLYADPEIGLSIRAAEACAEAILGASTVSPDGFANLRFAALANVPPGGPFFPAAFHRGGRPAIAIATESADLAVESVTDASSLATVRQHLVTSIETHAGALTLAAEPIAAEHSIRFLGIDFSLAPFPEPERSIGSAIETLSATEAGLHGTVAGAAFLADCLDQAQFQRTGFSGLILPVLEDSVLADRAAEGLLGIKDLLLLSTVCGTGLDTIPLPGNVDQNAVTALLVDLGALALRHDKPLTARLMPIPRKSAGDEIHFDFPYFADSKVMALPEQRLSELWISSGLLDLNRKL
jgi:uncharacterized protein (UPF0210 family)